jgi:hypothetical protein
MSAVTLPKRSRGRQTATAQALYGQEIRAFCAAILEINSRLDFKVSSRGWCYLLEEHGLAKGDFDTAQKLINDCRKSGDLPLDICAEDGKREFDHLERLDATTPGREARVIVDMVRWLPSRYTPLSFWDDRDHYLQMLVEKIDLRSLFSGICARHRVPLANSGGWADINGRAAMMRRFAKWEAKGKRCVLLYCGDHDPGGLSISGFLRSNLTDLSAAVGWSPDNLIIDRFGLNFDFIEAHGLTWIDNLETGAGGRLDDPTHPDHGKAYVQDYLRRFGARKVEANALVARPQAGRELCRQAILNYVAEDAPDRYLERLKPLRDEVSVKVLDLLAEEFGQ